MKLRTNIPAGRRRSGMTLIECLVYFVVFSILTGIGLASFYCCWDHTRGTIFTADDIAAAMRAGECWRTDIRAATGTISIETTPAGETARIPAGGREILYRFTDGELRREVPTQHNSRLLLAKVKTSEMKTEARDGVTAWRWELETIPKQKNTHFPLVFTFEAAQTKP
ncbi:MAG: prepilin-type N-terminal cleavage/methylation domain-containing protein [Verrucomicrobiae bacterium]|nr:prepilin-type N-terminal cleavage/methylation domain-containing protein [Verrucomicrobiae bacterium]